MHLIVGLGNPGRQYTETRHNIGFAVLDALAARNGIIIQKKKFISLLGRGCVKKTDVLLAKPQTFMNLSGRAVRQIVDFYKLTLDRLLVLHDDMDLAFGRIKVTARGGAGGHKGVASLMEYLGDDAFPRIKIGVGRPGQGREATGYVLGRFAPEDVEPLKFILMCAVFIMLTRGYVLMQGKFQIYPMMRYLRWQVQVQKLCRQGQLK